MRFTDFDFHPDIQKGIQEAGFEECMPVQEQCFQAIFAGKDVTAQSQTGTGKTAAFLLSIYHLFLSDTVEKKKALIIAPTRELVVQIEEEAKQLGSHLDFKVGSFYGGVGYADQERMLREGVDIVVGTPGRLIDFGKQKKMDFKGFGAVVIDEADRLFDMGFLPDLRRIVKMLPPLDERRTMLFSATMSVRVQNLAWEYMRDPVHIEIEPESITVEEIDQSIYHLSRDEKMRALIGIFKTMQPANAIIFTNTKFAAVEVAKRLSLNGFPCEYIMGDMPQKKRLSTINRIKKGDLRFLVATDVAARGLHINDLDMVINYDVPEDPESYVHRIGRTARAGREGKAITLACERFVYGLPAIESFIGMKIPVAELDPSLLAEDQSAGMNVMHDHYLKRDRGDRRNDRRGDRKRGDKRPDRRGGRRDSRGRDKDRSREISENIESVTGRNTGVGKGNDQRRDKTEKPRNRKKEAPRDSRRSQPAGAARRGKKPDAEAQQQKRREPRNQPPRRTNRKMTPELARKGDQSLESRVEYYRQKYGENFTISPELAQAEKKHAKVSLFKKISRFLKGKKS
jgi:ATP-dependent RNA helicase RhlB